MSNKTYSGPDFQVLWQPSVCSHSKVCFTDMQEVYDPFRRPWIILENGEREAIKQQVMDCPSGAFKWIENKAAKAHVEEKANADLIHVETKTNGPLMIKGEFMLIHSNVRRELKKKQLLYVAAAPRLKSLFAMAATIKLVL